MLTGVKGVGAAVVALVLALAVVVAPRAALADDGVTITFDLGYETTEEPPAPVTLESDESLYSLPEVSREGATFDGWWRGYDGNTMSRKATVPYSSRWNVTLTAHWILDTYEDVVYTTLSNDGKTLTYSYGDVNVLDGTHDVYELPEMFVDEEYSGLVAFPLGLMDGFDADAVEHVVFDESMSEWHPQGAQLDAIFNFGKFDAFGNKRPWRVGASVTSVDGIENLDASETTTVEGLFGGFQSLRNVDLSSLDLSNVTSCAYLFDSCSTLETFNLPSDMSSCDNLYGMFADTKIDSVDLSGTTFAPVHYIDSMFLGNDVLESVNLSTVSFADDADQYADLFDASNNVRSITVGDGWRWYDYADEGVSVNIPQPPVDEHHTGKWWRGLGTQAYTPSEMGALTNPDEIAGTWTWERRHYEVSFDLGYETDEQAPETVYVDLDGSIAELPTVSRDGYLFTGWADSNGYVYSPYKPTDDVCLVAQWSEVKPDPKPVAVEKVYMHRLYNPNSGEHFYTASTFERDHLVSVGWNYEGYAWGCPRISRTPVYRLYNPVSGDNHHYTVSAHERDVLVKAGWTDEGIAWYGVDDSCKDGTEVNVLRAYNPYTVTHKGTHNWTTSAYEQKTICDLGWRDEGVSFVAYPPKS